MSKTKPGRTMDGRVIRDFWSAGKQFKKGFILTWLSPIPALGISIAIPYIIGKILASLVRPGSDIHGYVVALIVVSVLTVIINRYTFSAYLAWQPKVMAYLQKKVLSSLLDRGLSFHNNQVAGKLVSDALDYPSAFSQLSTAFFIDIVPFILVMVIGITLVSISAPIIGLVLLVMTALVIYMTFRFRRRMAPYRKERQVATKAVTAHLADTIVNSAAVKAFGNERVELGRHDGLSDTLLASRLHDWGEVAKDGNRRITGLLLFEVIFVLVVAHQVARDPSVLAAGIFAFSYTVTLSNRLFQIGTMMRQTEEALLLAAPATEMLSQDTEVTDSAGAGNLQVAKGAIHIKDVSFRYQESAGRSSVFKHLNLQIKPGEKIGLVGQSGSGKSTLTKLLLRFEDINDGSITIDSQDIRNVRQTSLRRNIGYVPQEPLLFHRSIRENISYGKEADVSDAEIRAAADKAYALEFIEALPAGFDTVVGERGVKLSGGQRQRIAIARAILKDAPVLILDEATSALDSESELVIQKALEQLMQQRTAIVIAHRLSTVQKMDRIIVLDDGKIVEQGTHKQLLAKNGTYARLWAHQSGGFISED